LHERNERIPQHQVARLLKALTDALDYAHRHDVVHRDIKHRYLFARRGLV
jgi:serine/threonine protein kinase